jgi:hypothetical protein
VVNIKPTLSREREIRITRKEYGLIPLHIKLEALTINLKGKPMHPMEI